MTPEEMAEDVVVLRAALTAALPHVHRQVTAGKHEQDRIDAEAFLRIYGELGAELHRRRSLPADAGLGLT